MAKKPSAKSQTPKLPDPDVPNPDGGFPKDDRAYFRDDGDLVESAIKGKSPIAVYFGLRRYGKTWFLSRIAHWCATGRESISPKDYLVVTCFVPDESPESMADKVAALNADMENEKRTVLLIVDDLQKIGDDTVSAQQAEQFAFQLERFVSIARKRGKARLIMCEPTNLVEWLNGDAGRHGEMFRPFLTWQDFIISAGNTLPPLRYEGDERSDAHKLLSADVGGVPRVPNLDPQLSQNLCRWAGGNPWLLSHVYRFVAQGHTSQRDFDEICSTISKNVLSHPKQRDRMDTIYHSLNKQERLFLRLVLDARGEARTQHYMRSDSSDIWTNDGLATAKRLKRLGLVVGELGAGVRLIPIMKDYLIEEYPGYATFRKPHREDEEVWRELLRVESPNSARKGEIIIHQLSDLYLQDGANRQWDAYIAKLKEIDARRHKDKDERPDLIIICGNLIAVPCTSRSTPFCRDTHMMNLQAAADMLRDALPYMREGKDQTSATPDQIIVIPGIFDLDWSRENGPNSTAYRSAWEAAMRGFTLAGAPYLNEVFGIRILPFDTTDLAGAFEEGGKEASSELARLRSKLQGWFGEDWSALRQSGYGTDKAAPKSSRDAEPLRRLADLTLGYSAQNDDDDNAVSDPTFQWRSTSRGGGDGAAHSYVSDTGFISAKQLAWLSDPKLKSDTSIINIAVTHHHPENPRRSSVIEFFDEHQFRRALARAGVSTVLHGRSAGQQVNSQEVSFTDRDDEGNPVVRSSSLDLIGSGSFAAFGISTDPALPAHPSFNQITVFRPTPKSTERPRLEIVLFEYDTDDKTIKERGSVGRKST